MYPRTMTEGEFHKALTFWWIVLAFVTFGILHFITAPYGRHAEKIKLGINNRLCWFLMEIPSPVLVVGLSLWAAPLHYDSARIFFAFLWFAHYFHRCVIFPLRIESKTSTMNIPVLLQAFGFNLINGYINGRYLWTLSPASDYSFDYLLQPNVFIGFLFFLIGAFINIKSDIIVANLRSKPSSSSSSTDKKSDEKRGDEYISESGSVYKIPRGFLFEYIASPNYFGEIIEWTGYFIMTLNYATLSFLIWNLANLVPRAKSHLNWNQSHFPNYPPNRKAVVPFFY